LEPYFSAAPAEQFLADLSASEPHAQRRMAMGYRAFDLSREGNRWRVSDAGLVERGGDPVGEGFRAAG
jgi:hypothetical protein